MEILAKKYSKSRHCGQVLMRSESPTKLNHLFLGINTPSARTLSPPLVERNWPCLAENQKVAHTISKAQRQWRLKRLASWSWGRVKVASRGLGVRGMGHEPNCRLMSDCASEWAAVEKLSGSHCCSRLRYYFCFCIQSSC